MDSPNKEGERLKIVALVVTYNRLQLLKKTLKAYACQKRIPDMVLVVDNCSTDGTQAYLESWNAEKKPFESKVYCLPENRGGSGGFSFGMSVALETDCDWVFVADDDAVPRPDMFERLYNFCDAHPDHLSQAAALCTAVYQGGRPARNHRCFWKNTPVGKMEFYVKDEQYQDEYFDVDLYTFVGAMIRTTVLRQAGIAREDFFIDGDDFEHAERVRRFGRIICVPGAIMDHTYNPVHSHVTTWRDYYATRNHTLMYKIHFGNYAAFWRAARRLVLAVLFYAPEKVKVTWAGAVDAFKMKTGLHPIYRPGWRPAREKGPKKKQTS